MTTFHIGTMGYGYKDWLGVFYPEKTRSDTYLTLYSRIFDAVEMDTTFYATPRREIVQRWYDQAPDGFIFCPKTPRSITHDTELENGVGLMAEFVDVISLLGNKLGPILIQFPPEFDSGHTRELNSFLRGVPSQARYAVEFRHRSWDTPETYQLLQKHNICMVSTEYIIMTPRIYRTTDFLYLRFLGRHGAFEQKNRVQKDVIPLLEKWQGWLEQEISHVNAVYAFFNDDFSGHSPATANHFKAILGLPVSEPEIPQQPTLF
jgi:uncharacterized protein YecE (DUF72 family)